MGSNSLRDKIVVVTGGSAGLGRATAVAFAKRGAHVAILARDADRLRDAEAEIAQYGGRVLALPVDVADAGAVQEAADEVEEKLGLIDIWVNNAMTTVFAPLEQVEPAEFKRATEVTYLGSVYGTMAALKRMCVAETVASSCRWGPRSLIAQSRYNRLTAAPSTPCTASQTRCAAS
jgi:NAD(P)-dependent dehydrogenase (short-subunit alcohol dehydrogenase family)